MGFLQLGRPGLPFAQVLVEVVPPAGSRLPTVVDACAYTIAYGPEDATDAADITFRIGAHALADLAYVFSARRVKRDPESRARERLSRDDLAELRSQLENSGLHSEADEEACAEHLGELRSSYEPFAIAIARHLALGLPDWLPEQEVREAWRTAAGRSRD